MAKLPKGQGSKKRGDQTLYMGLPSPEALPVLVRPKLRLEVTKGPDEGRAVVCEEKVLHVGTQRGNTLELSDQTVSRIHLQLTATAAGVQVRDLSSTNGTWLAGGVRITEAVVPSGTFLQVGQTRIRLQALDEQVSESLSNRTGFGEMVGESPAMRAVFATLERVAPTDETVLISGETGTGKELCARAIVEHSPRIGKPLVIVDCGAFPPNLLESELFGHVRGAFTGAVSDHEGAFERAQGGTLFLDEIGELPTEFQTRLLRAVENRSIRRVGGTREIPLDIRIIAATNRVLEEEVNRGTFRADLYYRLSVVQVRIPPLRDRPEDIEPLARHLLQQVDGSPELELDRQTLERMRSYRWPGNAREMRNYLRRLTLGQAVAPDAGGVADDDEVEVDISVPFKDAKEGAIVRFERRYLSALLEAAGGNISQAARIAQTDRTYLSRLVAKYRLDNR